MIPTQSTRLPAHIYYGNMADALERDPIQRDATRVTVPMGRGFGLWQRMNPGVELVYVNDMEGRPRGLTPKQADVAGLAISMVDGEMLTMREMAHRLGVATSTVSRALTKLQSWGIIAYMVGRGRYAGLVIVRRVAGDRFDYMRKAAQARVRRWSEAAQRRLSRLQINVAPYLLEGGMRVVSSTSTKGATLTAQRKWTPEDMRDLDREMGCVS